VVTPTRVELGRVARSQADGTLIVVMYGDDPVNLAAAEEVMLDGEPGSIPFKVAEVSPAPGRSDGRLRMRLRVLGIDSRERAEAWGGAAVSISERELRQLPEGEYYWRDLIGLRAELLDGTPLGPVTEIWATGANDVLVVQRGSSDLLIPASEDVLIRVDKQAGVLVIDPPEGLLDAADDAEPS
jgi:16S rRNA processing protein RimM